MKLQRSRSGDRGISVVIGTVLLVGIVTMTMAILAAALLGGDFYSQSPNADIIYEEDADGSVLIALADVRGLSAGNTEIKLENGGSCGYWDGSGTLGKGDATTVTGGDCSKSLEEGDVLQVIGANRLIDTYVVRGVSPKYDRCEDAIESGELRVETGDEFECDLVGEDGGRVDVDLEMYGGELAGDVNLSTDGDLDLHGGTIDGDVESERFSLETDWTITGDLTVPASANEGEFTLKSRTGVGGSIFSDKNSIELEPGVSVGENVYITGPDEELNVKREGTISGEVDVDESSVRLEKDTTVSGPVSAGDLSLGEQATVENDVDITGTISLKSSALIEGTVTAGNVLFDGDATIDGDVYTGDITMEPDGTIRGNVVGDEILLKDRVTINGDVSGSEIDLRNDVIIYGDVTEGDIVNCGANAKINGDPCHEHENYTGG